MKSNKQLAILLLSALVAIPAIVWMENVPPKTSNPDLDRVEFFVS
jgi:hypothetical protein